MFLLRKSGDTILAAKTVATISFPRYPPWHFKMRWTVEILFTIPISFCNVLLDCRKIFTILYTPTMRILKSRTDTHTKQPIIRPSFFLSASCLCPKIFYWLCFSQHEVYFFSCFISFQAYLRESRFYIVGSRKFARCIFHYFHLYFFHVILPEKI